MSWDTPSLLNQYIRAVSEDNLESHLPLLISSFEEKLKKDKHWEIISTYNDFKTVLESEKIKYDFGSIKSRIIELYSKEIKTQAGVPTSEDLAYYQKVRENIENELGMIIEEPNYKVENLELSKREKLYNTFKKLYDFIVKEKINYDISELLTILIDVHLEKRYNCRSEELYNNYLRLKELSGLHFQPADLSGSQRHLITSLKGNVGVYLMETDKYIETVLWIDNIIKEEEIIGFDTLDLKKNLINYYEDKVREWAKKHEYAMACSYLDNIIQISETFQAEYNPEKLIDECGLKTALKIIK